LGKEYGTKRGYWEQHKEKLAKTYMRTLGKEYGMRRGKWEVHGGLGISMNNI
jgi:hypothetical protein